MASRIASLFEGLLLDTPSIKDLNPMLKAASVSARVWVLEKNLEYGVKAEAATYMAAEDLPEDERAELIDKLVNYIERNQRRGKPVKKSDKSSAKTQTQMSFREKVRVLTNPRV
ncbi:hypothetical protein GX865_03320 [Candidatus Saccharibacteria bacterium]|jgi:hypothetical protein|nr:hypothetical protein [Candidatus Saccharibacteria bacterium]